MEKISVIMPAYNCEKYIRQAIDSILNQTYQNIELLISDDKSTDNTKKILDSYSDTRIKRFDNNINLGYLKTFNKLIALAEGDYITFQDGDDYSELNRLELLLKEFKNDNELGACGSNYNRVDAKRNIVSTSNFALTHEEILSKIPSEFDFAGSGLMIKKEVYYVIGGYNDYFDRIGAEDFYWTYLITEKFKIKNLKNALYNYRYNLNSVSGDWSDNPKKIHTNTIVKYLINYRKIYGFDPLSINNISELDDYVRNLNIQYVKDPSLFFMTLATKYFYSELYIRSFKLCLKAILKNKCKLENYRNLSYFCKTLIKNKILK